jgi:hypothetical protein
MGIRARSALLEIAKAGEPARMKALLDKAGRLGLTRDDLRRTERARPAKGGAGGRKRPYVFKFRSPDKKYSLNLTFRQSTVERRDLIAAIEQILEQLRTSKE